MRIKLRAGGGHETSVLDLKVISLGVKNAGELDEAFATIVKEKPDALNVLADRIFLHNREHIMEFAMRQKLPGVHAYREIVLAGGLFSYGPSYADMHRRAATYVDKILRGEKPANLPIQAPTKFEMVLNLRTARALQIAIPATVIARADEVID